MVAFFSYGVLMEVAGICDYVPNSIEPWSTCEGGCQNWGGIYQAYAWVQVRKICICQGYACVRINVAYARPRSLCLRPAARSPPDLTAVT